MSDQRTPSAFSLSLKQFLGITLLFGPGIGVVGHIYNEYHAYYPAALISFFAAIPFLIATITLIRLGMSRQSRNLILWGSLCLTMPLMGGLAYWQFPWSTDGVSHLTNRKLVEKTAFGWRSRKVCNELTKRAEQGTLNANQAQAAYENLLSWIQNKQPANSFENTKAGMGFIAAAQKKGLLVENIETKIWDCVYDPLGMIYLCQKRRNTDNNCEFIFTINQQHLFDYEYCLLPIWSYKHISVDGKTIETQVETDSGYGGNIPIANNHQIYVTADKIIVPLAKLSPGNHVISIDAEFAYVRPESIEGLKVGYLNKEIWPDTIKEWQKTVTQEFYVYSEKEPLVARITDPKFDPIKKQVVTVDKLLLQRAADGQSLLLLNYSYTNLEHVTYSMKVTAEVEGKRHLLGNFNSRKPPRRWWQYWNSPERITEDKMEKIIPTPPENLAEIDLLFEPNLSKAFLEQGNVEAVWNKSVWLRDVAVDRRDLEKSESE